MQSQFIVNIQHNEGSNSNSNSKIVIEFRTKSYQDQHQNDDADELQFATNWTRAFKIQNQFIKWINAFGIINEIAATKVFKKFLKNHFALKDNVIDKIINAELQKYEFVRRRNVVAFTKDLNNVFAKFFTKGNREKAKKILDGDRFLVSNRDLFVVSFLGGGSVFLLLATLVFCLLDVNFGIKN